VDSGGSITAGSAEWHYQTAIIKEVKLLEIGVRGLHPLPIGLPLPALELDLVQPLPACEYL